MLFLYIRHCIDSGWLVAKMNRCMSGLMFGFKLRGHQDLTKNF